MNLFQPFTLPNGTVIKNRFVKAAMNEAMGDKYCQPKKEIAQLYRTWAQGGAGLVFTGNVMLGPDALAEPGNIVFNQQSDMTILREWAEAGKVNNTQIMVQINHPGRQAPKTVAKQPLAPSAVAIEGSIGDFFNKPKAMSQEDIYQVVEQFAVAAEVAQQAGLSGVEIHAAHGYLINQFLSSHTNRRTDSYGGAIEGRMQFLVEVYQAMRQKVGTDFPIGLKLNSPEGPDFTEEEAFVVIDKLVSLGVDFLEISGGSYEKPTMNADHHAVFFADFSQKVKERVTVPVIVTGGIRTLEAMEEVMENGIADFVGLARPMAIQPDIPNRVAAGTYEIVATQRLSTGVKAIDKKLGSLLGLVYYQMLMQRIAKGKAPKAMRNAWPALLHAVYHQGLAVLSPQRAK